MGQRIQLYIDHKVRDPQDGGYTDGIRIRPFKPKAPEPVPPCERCGREIKPAWKKTPAQVAAYTKANTGMCLCAACALEVKAEQDAQKVEQEAADAAK